MNIYENEQDHLPKISEAELSDEQVMAELHSIKKEPLPKQFRYCLRYTEHGKRASSSVR